MCCLQNCPVAFPFYGHDSSPEIFFSLEIYVFFNSQINPLRIPQNFILLASNHPLPSLPGSLLSLRLPTRRELGPRKLSQSWEEETAYAQATFISPHLSEKLLVESSWLNVLSEKQWFQGGHGLDNTESDRIQSAPRVLYKEC